MLRDPAAHLPILPVDGPALPLQHLDDLLRRPCRPVRPGQHPLQRPAQVHRRGPGGRQAGSPLPQPGAERRLHRRPVRQSSGQHIQGIRRKDADGWGAPHPQGADSLRQLFRLFQFQPDLPVGKLALVQQPHPAAVLRQPKILVFLLPAGLLHQTASSLF